MNAAFRPRRPLQTFAVASLLGALLAPAALAQPAAPRLDAPPPLPAAGSAQPAAVPPKAADKPSDAAESKGEPEDLPPARPVPRETRIEQRRMGNRVVEITVTPAGATRSYVIVNREGERPANVQDLSSGLSTPRFFKFDF